MYFVYIVSNWNNRVIYIGVTNDLQRRIYEHKNKKVEGFTKKYNVNKLVHYETFSDIKEAIAREKQIKGWLRSRKNELIERTNPTWEDLSDSWREGFFANAQNDRDKKAFKE